MRIHNYMVPFFLMNFTNEDIRNSESFKEYYAIALGAEPLKTKERVKKKQVGSDMSKTPPTKGKRLKTSAKAAKTAKKKQPAKTSKAKGIDEGTDSIPGVPDVPTYESDDEKISWKSSKEDDDDEVNVSEDDDDDNDDDIYKDDEDDDADNQDDENPDDANQDDDDEQTELDNDRDNFVHPKLSTHDDEARQDDVVNEEESDDESNEDSDEEVQGAIIKEKEMDEEATHEEDEVNELYKDMNVNLEGRDTKMIDAPLHNCYSVSSGFISNMLNPRPDTGIDTIFTLNNEETSLVDVLVITIAEPPLLSAITLPPPPTPLIIHLQQTPVPAPATVLSSSLQYLPNFGSLFRFDHTLKTLETDFSEFKQTNQFAEAVSFIPGIVDAYLANKMHEAVKTAVQIQSERLRDEAQAKNADFLNKLDDNIKKIIKDQVKEQVKAQDSKILPKIEKTVNEQLEAEVMTRSSTESMTSLAITAKLSELELKKILIDKMESNKSIHRSDEQHILYKALVDAYESDKLILDTYGDSILFKRRRDDEYKDEEPSAGSNRGSKRSRAGKELESTSAPKENTSKTSGKSYEGSKSQNKTTGESAQTEEPMHTTKDLEEPTHQEFETGVTEDQHNEETHQFPDWFQRPTKLPSLDRDWNKTLPDAHGHVDTLTPELLTGPTFELMKGSCKSLVELEYLFEEVYKETIEQSDWNNPEGQQYLHDLQKPLPLIPNSRGRRVIPFDNFINNDLEYLSDGVSSKKYATSVTKTKATNYGHIKWIEDLVPNRMESARDVYSKRRIIAVTKLEIVNWHNYKHLDWITVRRDDDKLYKFKEGDFNRLRIQDIEDMLLLLVQGKLTNLTLEERLALNVSLRMFIRSVVIRRSMEDLQLGVESYQKKLNLTKPDTYKPDLKRREAYTAYSNPRGFIYQNKDKKNRLMRIDELHKFSDGTLNDVRTALNDRLKGIQMEYLPQTIWRQRKVPTEMELVLEQTQQGSSYEVSVSTEGVEELKRIVRIKGEKKEALHSLRQKPEHTEFDESNTNVLERFYTSAENPVKEILLKLNLPDHRLLKDGGKVKEPQERCIIKLFKITYQERYGHVSPEVTSSQDGKGHKMAKGDYAWLMISRCSRLHSRQAKE
ncbi:hypothetical protein Tco_0014450 [Tanacetum coccineum]